MHPAKQAESLIEALHDKIEKDGAQKPEHVANVMAQAQVFAILALSQSIEGLGIDIREAMRGIDTELGSISIALGNIADGLPK